MEGEKWILSELGESCFNKIKPKPLLPRLQRAPEPAERTHYFLFYFQKKLLGSSNCLNRGKRMFIVEAAAAWEGRSCLGHNLGAKRLVAAVQLHLRACVG